jgi:hypothetical protein
LGSNPATQLIMRHSPNKIFGRATVQAALIDAPTAGGIKNENNLESHEQK